MLITISGTPGTGKNTIADLLAKKLNFKEIDLNKLAEQKNLYSGFDKERGCKIVDTEKINSEIKKVKGNLIIQSHYAHLLDSDLVIVLRTNSEVLRKRLEKRGWPEKKINENIESEIMEICKTETLEAGKDLLEIDTTKKSPKETVNEIIDKLILEDLKLPEKLRSLFKEPFGELVKLESILKTKYKKLICVGDVVAYNSIQFGIKPDIIIVDKKEKRKPFTKKIEFKGKELNLKNPQAHITKDLWYKISSALVCSEPVKISVEGEEDLAVLPSVILSPIGLIVIYGQPDKGLVLIKVDKKKKKEAKAILNKIKALQ